MNLLNSTYDALRFKLFTAEKTSEIECVWSPALTDAEGRSGKLGWQTTEINF